MDRIDWNAAGEQGLIERINTEILHPIGLAMCRETETGVSPYLLVADDGKWEYAQGTPDILPTVKAQRNEMAVLLKEISNWLVCEAIAPPEDMAQSFTPFREQIDELLKRVDGAS